MKRALADKIASVTINCGIDRELRLTDEFPCQEGDVVAVRVLSRKATYNQLELTSGRFSTLKVGDVIVGALGHRRALSGYAGHIPEELSVGDTINILNLGGVLGVCDSMNPDVGAPFDCEVLGQVLHFPGLADRRGVPANINQGAFPLLENTNLTGVPIVAMVGTCMDSGKTLACSALIQELTHRRLRVMAAKATGVSLRRDILMMEDAGAQKTLVFTDFGIVTTTDANGPIATRNLLGSLVDEKPDVIVLELGDGLLGTYGVQAILADPQIVSSLSAVILAASDPVGAWGGVQILQNTYGIKPTVITGPATDNIAGTELILEKTGIPAANARTSPDKLTELIMDQLGVNGGGA